MLQLNDVIYILVLLACQSLHCAQWTDLSTRRRVLLMLVQRFAAFFYMLRPFQKTLCQLLLPDQTLDHLCRLTWERAELLEKD